MLFLRADLSMAEGRVVNVLTHDPELLRIARSNPWEFDTHKFMASAVFGIPETEINREQRQAGKKIIHASNYDVQPARMSEGLLKEGFIFAEEECARAQQKYLGRFPAIQGVFHFNIRMKLIRERKLTNSWGASIFFPFERLEPSLYRRGYAWVPQSEIGRLLNQKGFVPTDQFLLRNNLHSRINLQVHDEICLSTCPEEVWDVMRFIQESLCVEREYEGEKLAIPIEYAIERRYHAEEVVFKRFPESKDELLAKFMPLWETRIR